MRHFLYNLLNPQTSRGLILIAVISGLIVVFISWFCKRLFSQDKGNNQVAYGNGAIQINNSKKINIGVKKENE